MTRNLHKYNEILFTFFFHKRNIIETKPDYKRLILNFNKLHIHCSFQFFFITIKKGEKHN